MLGMAMPSVVRSRVTVDDEPFADALCQYTRRSDDFGRKLAEELADKRARLIEASPQMLKALKRIAQHFPEEIITDEGFVHVTVELQGAEMLDVLAAIDAAEGKS